MKRISTEEIREHIRKIRDNKYPYDFYPAIEAELEKENPILYEIYHKEMAKFAKERNGAFSVSITRLLQIIFLLQPLPVVTLMALEIAKNKNNLFWDGEVEALLEELREFKEENPHLHNFASSFVCSIDNKKAELRNGLIVLKWIRLIRIQEELDKTRRS